MQLELSAIEAIIAIVIGIATIVGAGISFGGMTSRIVFRKELKEALSEIRTEQERMWHYAGAIKEDMQVLKERVAVLEAKHEEK